MSEFPKGLALSHFLGGPVKKTTLYDLKRFVDLRGLFDLVLNSSLDDLVINACNILLSAHTNENQISHIFILYFRIGHQAS